MSLIFCNKDSSFVCKVTSPWRQANPQITANQQKKRRQCFFPKMRRCVDDVSTKMLVTKTGTLMKDSSVAGTIEVKSYQAIVSCLKFYKSVDCCASVYKISEFNYFHWSEIKPVKAAHLDGYHPMNPCPVYEKSKVLSQRVGRDYGAATGPVSVTSQLKMSDKPGAGWLICPTCLKSRTGPLSLLVFAMVSKRAQVDWLSHSMLALLLVLSTCLLHISV